MPLINLIQEQRLAARKNEQRARAFFLTFAVTFVAAGGAYGLVYIQDENLKSEEAKLRNQLRTNEPLIAEIEKNDAESAKLTPRLKTLEDAQLISERWNKIMRHVATQSPPNMWLTAMRATASDPTKPISLSLVGVGPFQEPIGEFMLRLQNCADLEAVTLKYTQEKILATGRGIEFEISADIVGTAEEQPKNEEEKAK
jgi:Tfp pilus assembly protein PilN